MSQANVERVIGGLATDEALRRQFTANPKATLLKLIERGADLTPCEVASLSSLDQAELARFAKAIDARLQKTDLQKRGVT